MTKENLSHTFRYLITSGLVKVKIYKLSNIKESQKLLNPIIQRRF